MSTSLSTIEEAFEALRAGLPVLVTDDEPITRMLVKLLLEQDGFEVLEATNGKQAVDIAAALSRGMQTWSHAEA